MKKITIPAVFLLSSSFILAQNTASKDSVKTRSIEEVVVLGYKTQKKSNTSESYSVVGKEKLKSVTTPNVANMLQGRAAGVNVTQSSGEPGASADITIRGITSISGAVRPLWVVDGVIFNGVPNLDPNQIESVSVLKDAASTALYGSRGANGVIQVTTKSGSRGAGRISLSSNTTISMFNTGKFKLMNGQQMYDFYANEMKYPADTDFTPDLQKRSFDWVKNGTEAGITQNHTVEFSGGNEKSRTYISGNYFRETGTVIGNTLERIAFRINQDYQVKDRLTIKPKLSVTYDKNDYRQHSLYEMYLNMPWDSPYLSSGKVGNPWYDYPTEGPDKWWGRDQNNYLYDLQWNYGKASSLNASINGDFDYKFSDKLTFSSVNNYSLYYDDSLDYTDPLSNSGEANQGGIYRYNAKRIARYFNQMLKYNFGFGAHKFQTLAGYEYTDTNVVSYDAGVYHIVGGKEVFNTGASSGNKPTGSGSENAYQGFLFNTNYSLSDKYLAQFSIRRDGSSVFGSDVRYGTFYSISGGWNLHKEEFMKRDWLNELKLRASYGSVGNTPAGTYGWQDLYAPTYIYNGNPGAVWAQLENLNYSWETVKTTDIGLDLRIFNRLGIKADYYIKDNNNLSYLYNYPVLAGGLQQFQNIGRLQNKGFEFEVNYDVIKNSDLRWTIDFNIGLNRNKIMALKDGLPIPNGYFRYIEGEDVNQFYMRKWLGVDPKTGSPLWEVVGANGAVSSTTNYNVATVQKVGTGTPKYFGGLNSRLDYKGVFLDVNAYFSKGGLIYNSARELFDSDGAYPSYNQMLISEQGWTRWMKEGDVATHPKAVYNNGSLSNKTSSRYLEDGSFVKIKSIKLGYTVPSSWLSDMRVNNASIFVNAENLFTFTKFSFVDPEVGSGYAASASQYPIPRRITIGANLTF